MKKLLRKKLNKKGFTLAELLIVIAIIAVLVAIAVPIFTSQLHNARVARDEANLRSVKAAAVARLLSGEDGLDLDDGPWTAEAYIDEDYNIQRIEFKDNITQLEPGYFEYPGYIGVEIQAIDLSALGTPDP